MLSEINLFLNFSAKLFVESKSIIVGPSSILAKRKDSIAWSYIYYEWIAAVSASASFIANTFWKRLSNFQNTFKVEVLLPDIVCRKLLGIMPGIIYD